MDPVILLLLSSITTDWVWLLIFTRFLDHTQRRTTVCWTPLNEWSVRRRDVYLTTHNNHKKHPCHPTCWGFLFTLKNPTASAGFEPANLGTKVQHATSRPPKPLTYTRNINYVAFINKAGSAGVRWDAVWYLVCLPTDKRSRTVDVLCLCRSWYLNHWSVRLSIVALRTVSTLWSSSTLNLSHLPSQRMPSVPQEGYGSPWSKFVS